MRYSTRENVHVDRIASAWLIKRFVDPDAEFVFTTEATAISGAVPFDIPGADLGHHGSHCTFETIIERYALNENGLPELAAIIHGADILPDSDTTLESPGIDLAFRAIRISCNNDLEALEFGFRFMDGLLRAIQERGLR